jgi:hypothetical protein
MSPITGLTEPTSTARDGGAVCSPPESSKESGDLSSAGDAARPRNRGRSTGAKRGCELRDPVAVARRLRAACRRLLDLRGDDAVENRLVPRIERIVTESTDDPGWANAVLKQLPPSHVAASQAARSSYESRLEFECADKVLAGEGAIADYRFYKVAEQLVGEELSLVPVKPENVLLIGSGPLPLSGVLVHRMTGAQVACVDCDPRAIAQSSRLLRKLGLDQALEVSCCHGEKIQASHYDLVVIALLAKPKAAILANLSQTIRRDSYILCRTSTGLRTLLYEPADVTLGPAFEVVDEQIAVGNLAVSTMLLRPCASQAADFRCR